MSQRKLYSVKFFAIKILKHCCELCIILYCLYQVSVFKKRINKTFLKKLYVAKILRDIVAYKVSMQKFQKAMTHIFFKIP